MNTIRIKQTASSNDDEIDLVALLNQLIANKWLIIITTLVTLSLGYISAHRKIPQYQADVMLQVDVIRPGFGGGGFGGPFALGAGSSAASASTQMALIKSRVVLDPVIEELGLDIMISPQKPPLWKRLFQHKQTNKHIQVQTFDIPKKKLNKPYQLRVEKPGYLSLYDSKKKLILQGPIGKPITNSDKTIRLEVKSAHIPVGQRFLLVKRSKINVEKALRNQIQLKEAEGNGKSMVMSSTGILYVTLKGSDPKQIVQILNAIATTAKKLDLKRKSQEASQTLAFLTQQLPITKGELEKAEYNLNRYRAKSGKIDIKFQSQTLIHQFSELDKELGKLRIEKINMQQEYTPAHPKLMAMDTQVKALGAQRQELVHSLKKLPASDQVAVNLLMDVKVKKTLYLMLLNRIQELHVAKAGTLSGLRILAMAKVPDTSLPNSRLATYAGSIFFGFLLSVLIIFGRRLLSTKVNDPHWGEQRFNLPNLAIIPYCKEQKISDSEYDNAKQITLLAYKNPRNLSVESLRSLRTSLQMAVVGARNNLVSILGISPGIGKSFVSANLAYLLASAGKKILIIDADLRRGTIHKYMGISPSPGLADVLNGTVTLEIALSTTMNENLTCLPRGTYPLDPSELLMSEQFKSVMQSLSTQYDMVIIDTAPILLVTDAVLVAGITGTNYIVLGAGIHEPTEIEMALKRLTSAGIHLHGSIFNFQRQQSKKSTYGHYKYSNYSNYYDDSIKVK
jgi:tyrosine-protein kinase Etk/Wzc